MDSPEPIWWTVYCDGSAVPNPGRMGLGAVITGPMGQVHTVSIHTHAVGCNNEAELRALVEALRQAQALGASDVKAFTDNRVLVDHLGPSRPGQVVRPIERLQTVFSEARLVIESLRQVQLHWVPRHRNSAADALARAALGMAPKPLRPHRKRR